VQSSRRAFLKTSSATLLATSTLTQSRLLFGAPKTLHVPLGLQLYSVRALLPKDYDSTLKEIGDLGYREAESAGYFNHTADEVKQAMAAANLHLVSAHHSSDDLHKKLDEIIAFDKEVGVSYIICSIAGFKDPSTPKNPDRNLAYTLDDWRWNAEQFNQIGEKVTAAGMRFGYHNHTMEFHEIEGVVPYKELLRLTDPAKVTFEMDCGWVVVGGGNPIDYLKNYPTRISMLHVKDFKPGTTPPAPAELGQGHIDYAPIFAEAAKAGNIKHCFVEQEGFNMPPMQSLKVDADYMRKLGVVS
jgi:sugar phosphate isomerase/epimerase